MAVRAVVPNPKAKALAPKKKAPKADRSMNPAEIAAGEFKAKCLAIIDEVNRTGCEIIITKRGKPAAKLIPFQEVSVDSLFDRMKGIVEIVGDPDDLVKPIIPLEDWESLQ